MFSVGSHTVGPTGLKFGMEDYIYPGEVIGYILFWYPYPQCPGGQRGVLEVHAAQTVHFCENFIKQKLKDIPENGGTGQVRSGLRPHLSVRQQCKGGFPRHGNSETLKLCREMGTHPRMVTLYVQTWY